MAADPPPAQPGPRPPGPATDALGLGASLGAWVWWCEQLFAVAGAWVPATDEAPARLHLAELSRVVGEHGATLARHLPRPAPVDPRGWVAPPSPPAGAVVDALAHPDATLERLAGVHRVLVPRLLVAWSAQAASGAPGARALARPLGHARTDLAALWTDGEGLLQALVAATDDGAARAAAQVAAVEAAVVAAGGLAPTGPVALPAAPADIG